MELFVVVLDPAKHFHCFRDRRLVYDNGLEAAFERGVLFDILAVFGKCGRADELKLAPRERGLENIGGTHASLGISGADNVVYLINHENDISRFLDLGEKPEDSGLKLPAELGSRDERGKIKKKNFLVFQLIRNIPGRDADGKRLRNGGLADTGLADQTGIVFLSAAKDLGNAGKLPVTPDNGVKPPFARRGSQVTAISTEELVFFFVLFLFSVFATAAAAWSGEVSSSAGTIPLSSNSFGKSMAGAPPSSLSSMSEGLSPESSSFAEDSISFMLSSNVSI